MQNSSNVTATGTAVRAGIAPDYSSLFVGMLRGVCAMLRPTALMGDAVAATDVIGIVPQMPARRTHVARATAVHLDPRGAAARAFHVVAAKLTDAGQIVVTSERPGEGVSVCATNVALALASKGRSVLLVDANVGRATQHIHLNVTTSRGWSDAKGKAAAFLVQETDVDTLKLLPAGANPVAGPGALAPILDELSSEYQHVVIDAPAGWSMSADETLEVSRCGNHTVIARR